jgi:hypothetical protein
MDIEQLAGTKLGNYEIETLFGLGGMSVVYKVLSVSAFGTDRAFSGGRNHAGLLPFHSPRRMVGRPG